MLHEPVVGIDVEHLRPEIRVIAGRVAVAPDVREVRAAVARWHLRQVDAILLQGRSFERAYLIDLLAELLEGGTAMYRENTAGCYMEIDTLQDLSFAESWWNAWKERASQA